jgi:hypothetical protein
LINLASKRSWKFFVKKKEINLCQREESMKKMLQIFGEQAAELMQRQSLEGNASTAQRELEVP